MHADSLFAGLSSPRQRWLTLGLVLVFVGCSIQYSLKAVDNRSAFLRWRSQIADLEKGVDIYERHNYPNPPIMALFLMPLVKVPPVVGALGWFYVKVGLTLLAMLWIFHLVEQPDRPFPLPAKVLTILLSLRPILGDLNHGNVNLLILFLVVAALYAYRRNRDLTSGVLLGLAIACKVTPALFVPYFLWKRSGRVLAGCALGLGLFLWPGLVPGALLGWERNQQLLGSWTDQMIKPFVVEGEVTSEHNNQSLPGLLTRLLTESPSFSTWDYAANRRTSEEYHNLVALDPSVVGWFVKGCLLLFAGLVVWTCRTPTQPRKSWRLAAESSIIVVGMLLFCERTWKHHCVTLLLPFAVLSYYLAVCRPGRWLGAYLIATLAMVALLMASTSTSLLEKDLAKLMQVYGAYVWAYLLLLAALVIVLRRGAPGSAPGARGSEDSTPGSIPSPPRGSIASSEPLGGVGV